MMKQLMNLFNNNNETTQYKNNFIIKHADGVYFDNIEAIDWLKCLTKELEFKLNK